MSQGYQTLSRLASHSNARGAPIREGYMSNLPGASAGTPVDSYCTLPAPVEPRIACTPASFSATDGRTHAVLLSAYGSSRPQARYV